MIIGGIAICVIALGGVLFAVGSDGGKTTTSSVPNSSQSYSHSSTPVLQSQRSSTTPTPLLGGDINNKPVSDNEIKQLCLQLETELQSKQQLTDMYKEVLNQAIIQCDTIAKDSTVISVRQYSLEEKVNCFVTSCWGIIEVLPIIQAQKHIDTKTEEKSKQLSQFVVHMLEVALGDSSSHKKIAAVLGIKSNLTTQELAEFLCFYFFSEPCYHASCGFNTLLRDITFNPEEHNDDTNTYNEILMFNENNNVIKYKKLLETLVDTTQNAKCSTFNFVRSLDDNLLKKFYTNQSIQYYSAEQQEYQNKIDNANIDYDNLLSLKVFGQSPVNKDRCDKEIKELDEKEKNLRDLVKNLYS